MRCDDRRNRIRLITTFLAALIVLAAAACGADVPAELPPEPEAMVETEPVHLKWYLGGDSVQLDQERVSNAMEDYLQETYGLHLELELVVIDFGNYADKAQMVLASDEEFDIMWTSTWCNNYYTNVSKGSFMCLDELLTEELEKVIPESLFDACRVNGSVYAVPSYQVSAFQNVISIPTRLVKEFHLDTESIHTVFDLNDFLYDVKRAYPDMYPLGLDNVKSFFNTYQSENYEYLIGAKIPGAIELTGNKIRVVNQFELPVSIEKYDLFHQWYQDGIISPEAGAVQSLSKDLQAGLHAAVVDTTWKPGFEIDLEKQFKEPVTCILIGDAWFTTSSATASMNAISSSCEHPETAMQFLTLLNTDAILYNMLCFGIEGVHYNLSEEGTVIVNEEMGYNPNCDWVFGCQFNAIPRVGQSPDIWEQTMEFSNSAKASPVIGFVFDTTPVNNEILACATVFDQFIAPLAVGAADPEIAFPEAMEKLKNAGYQVILDELQRQLDAWMGAKR